MKRLLLLAALSFATLASAAEIEVRPDIAYQSGDQLSAYEKEWCKLDLYLPEKREGCASLIWLYGGALKNGSKDKASTQAVARSLAEGGIAVAVVNYRLSPKVTYPAYIEDAAAAFAWVHAHAGDYGGSVDRVFISGHSAGAYLASMVGLDEKYLAPHGLKLTNVAGIIPVAGQMMTHFTVREERGLDVDRIIADDAAPITHLQKVTPPMLLILGDKDWPARLEENAYFAAAALKVSKNPGVTLLEIPNRTHGGIGDNIAHADDPARKAILDFIAKHSAK